MATKKEESLDTKTLGYKKRSANRGLAALSEDKKTEIQKAGNKKHSEECAKRRTMAKMFEEAMTLDKRRSIAQSLVFAAANGTVKIGDRIRILELILRLIGELPDGTTKTEIEALGDVVLKIN